MFSRRSIIIFILLFIAASIATFEYKSPYDGNDSLGFPFRFFEYLGGKRKPEPHTRYIFNYLILILDILVIGISSILMDRVWIEIKRKNARKKELK